MDIASPARCASHRVIADGVARRPNTRQLWQPGNYGGRCTTPNRLHAVRITAVVTRKSDPRTLSIIGVWQPSIRMEFRARCANIEIFKEPTAPRRVMRRARLRMQVDAAIAAD